MRLVLVFSLLTLVPQAPDAKQETWQGRVIRVVDGEPVKNVLRTWRARKITWINGARFQWLRAVEISASGLPLLTPQKGTLVATPNRTASCVAAS